MSLPPDEVAEPPDREPSIRAIAMPSDANPNGDIFGGWLMSQMDLGGANVAFRRARGRVVTVAVNSMTFISPVYVGDEVSIFAEIIGTGRTSIRVQVEAWRRDRFAETRHKVTQAIFTFVAVGEDRRPRPLPEEP